MIDNISFCVLPYARDPDALKRCVASIAKQRLPHYEILVSGDPCDLNDIVFIPSGGRRESGEFNRIRNQLVARATADFVLLIADAIALADGWYEAIKHADFLDVVGSQVTTEGGSRAIDWAYQVKLGSQSFAFPLDYDEWSTRAYVGGSLMLLRKKTWERLQFDEKLKRGDGDDVDFSIRATQAGYKIGVFPAACATCITAALDDQAELTFVNSRNTVAAFKQALAAGQEAFKACDYGRAITLFTRAVQTIPDDARALALMGWSHYFLGQYDPAIQFLDLALAADPVNHFTLRGRGWAALQIGEHRKAVEFLTRAIELITPDKRADWIETQRGLGWAHYHVGSYDAAITSFTALRETSSANEAGLLQDVYRGLGWSCYRIGSLSAAADHFKNAIRVLADDNPDLLREARHGLELACDDDSHVEPQQQESWPQPLTTPAAEQVSALTPTSTLRRRLAKVLGPLKRRLRL